MTPKTIYRNLRFGVKTVLPSKVRYVRRLLSNGFQTRTVLVYPQMPNPSTVLYRVCHLLGYRLTRDLNAKADLVFNWEDCTFRTPFTALDRLNEKQRVMNLGCRDISKQRVEEVHQKVLGYGLSVDPLTFTGRCVRKSNNNAAHDGVILQCPVESVDPDSIYQVIINNEIEGEQVEDIRVPIFGDQVPFCYLKRRPVRDRFSNVNASSHVREVADVLSPDEIALAVRFAREIGLDYGELDVLRNRDDGKIYIIDVNNTPFGPPNHLDAAGVELALQRLARAFQDAFMSPTTGR